MNRSQQSRGVLAQLRNRLRGRDEAGAGGLIPIIVIGVVVVVIAAFVASSTSYAAKVSSTQVKQMTSKMETQSLLNTFAAATMADAALAPTATVAGAGSYKIYYSTAATKPSKVTDAGVVALGTTGLPAGVRWLLVELTPENTQPQTAVYKFSPKASATHDSLISWAGSVNLNGAKLEAAPGATGPVVISAKGAAGNATSALRIAASIVSADVYADYSTQATKLTGGTLRGLLSSASPIEFAELPRVLGDSYSAGLISGVAETAGTQKANEAARPVVAERTANTLLRPGQQVALSGADCSTPDRLKSKIESITQETTFVNADVCATSSWNTEVKPKFPVLLMSTGNLSVNGLKVKGSTAPVSFAADGNLALTAVSYSDGAYGQYLSGGGLSVVDSQLNGAIASYGTAYGSLDISNSTVLYTPFPAALSGSCGAASCALASTTSHLIRVS